MIFQLSDWFPKPIIWAIIVKFDQIRKTDGEFLVLKFWRSEKIVSGRRR